MLVEHKDILGYNNWEGERALKIVIKSGLGVLIKAGKAQWRESEAGRRD